MTSVLDRPTAPVTPPPGPAPAAAGDGPSTPGTSRGRWAVWVGLLIGVAAVCLSYSVAGRATQSGEQAKFVLLWIGILAFAWPAAKRLANPRATESERMAIVTAAGLFTYLPKLLRSPDVAVFYDEIAHRTQVERLLEDGSLFQPNPAVRVIPSYPGLHTLTGALQELSGLSTWHAGILLIAVLHVVSAIGVYTLVRRVTASVVVAGLAGLIWCIAPGAMFFNAQFSYQSLAIVLYVWTAVCVAEAQSAHGRSRWSWTAIAAVLATAIVVTHHLTSYALVGLLLAFTIAALLGRRLDPPGSWQPAAALLGVALVVNAVWMWIRGGQRAVTSIRDYLMPYPEGGFDQIWGAITGTGERRTFFVRSGLPAWEQAAALIAPLAAIALGILGIRLLLRMSRRPSSAAWGLVGFSALYVAALPFVLTQSGAQGAHRSFPFTYLGVSLVVAAGLASLIGSASQRTGRARALRQTGILALIAVILVGNTAANVNEFDRFPGPWEAGADSRSHTAELDRAATWLRSFDSEDRLVADLYTGTTLGIEGTTRAACAVAAACPGDLAIWRFYDGQPIRERDIEVLRRDGYRFLAVDRRMATTTPRSGFWFNRGEEGAFEREPYEAAALARLEGFPWLRKVYASTNYDLYEIDLDLYGADVLRGEPGAVTKAREARQRELADAPAEGGGDPAATDPAAADPEAEPTADPTTEAAAPEEGS